MLARKVFGIATILLLFVEPSSAVQNPQNKTHAIGVVYNETTGLPFQQGEVLVTLLSKGKDVNDKTNDDGLYCVIVPDTLSECRLSFHSQGYWSQLTETLDARSDPLKVERVILRKKLPPRAAADLDDIRRRLEVEYAIYKVSTSVSLRSDIRMDLIAYDETLQSAKSGSLITSARARLQETLKKMSD